MKTIGVIHTTPATIQDLKQRIESAIEEVEVINILDDSILGDMITEHEVEYVKERWIGYARVLEKLGVEAILSACSTVGEFAETADKLLDVPVYRIDEAMAGKAVDKGGKIVVLATLNSTLGPTERLIKKISAEKNQQIELVPVLVEGAYSALMSGDKDTHNNKIVATVNSVFDEADVIVLAQASMANAITDSKLMEKVLTSPELGVNKLKEDLS